MLDVKVLGTGVSAGHERKQESKVNGRKKDAGEKMCVNGATHFKDVVSKRRR